MVLIITRDMLRTVLADTIQSARNNGERLGRLGGAMSFQGSLKRVQTACRISFPRATLERKEKASSNLRNKKMIPDSDPPSVQDVNLLYHFFDRSSKLLVLTGAGISTECGIPDYRSPNGAYSTGFRPITHQVHLQIEGVEQVADALAAIVHYQMVYRVQDHAMDLSTKRSSFVPFTHEDDIGLGAMLDGDVSLQHNLVQLMLLWHLLRKQDAYIF